MVLEKAPLPPLLRQCSTECHVAVLEALSRMSAKDMILGRAANMVAFLSSNTKRPGIV